jgi:tRNA dimethylallyltransferase
MSELRDRGVFATRQLAKRQITWLRNLPQRTVLEADRQDILKQALTWVEGRLSEA